MNIQKRRAKKRERKKVVWFQLELKMKFAKSTEQDKDGRRQSIFWWMLTVEF